MLFVRHPKWLTRTVASVLTPFYILTFSSGSYAIPNATGAKVSSFHEREGAGQLDRVLIADPQGPRTKLPFKNFELNQHSWYLWVPGDRVSRVNLSYVKGSQSLGPSVQAGPSDTSSSFSFPCTTKGSVIVGWQDKKTGERGCVPPGITVRGSRVGKEIRSKDLQVAQVTRNQLLGYCTVAAKDRGWWVRWGTYDDPCEEATQQCLRTGSASECQVVGLGDWRMKDQDLFVSVECASDRVFTGRGNGRQVANSLIESLAQEAKDDGSKACVLNVYQPDDLIVLPATDEVTLFQTHDFGDTLAIDALAGDVIIKSVKHSVGVRLKAGNRYTYPDDNAQPINVSEIAKSPAVQTFLDPSSWSPDDAAQLENYRRALGQSNKPSKGKNQILEALSVAAGLAAIGLTADAIKNNHSDRDSRRESNSPRNQPPKQSPNISVPDSLEFSSVGFENSLTVTNNGSAPLLVRSVSPSSASITVDECTNRNIPPGSSCVIKVKLNNAASGALTINSNAINVSQTVKLDYNPPKIQIH